MLENGDDTEAAEFEEIEEIVDDYFTPRARIANVESYGVGDVARVLNQMFKIRLLMEHHGMDVDNIGRCIRHRLRALKASRRQRKYFYPSFSLKKCLYVLNPSSRQQSVRRNRRHQRSLTSGITKKYVQVIVLSPGYGAITKNPLRSGRFSVKKEENEKDIKSEEDDEDIKSEEDDEDDEDIKSENDDDDVETEEEEEIARVDRNGFHYLA